MSKVYFAPDQMCTTLKLEAKRLQDFFVANGWSVTDNPENADKIICGVCVGFDSLVSYSLKHIKDLSVFGDKVAAIGCASGLTTELGESVSLGGSAPTIKISTPEELIPNPVIGINDISEPSTFRSKQDYRLYNLSKRFVNLALGCAFNCSFCLHKASIGDRKSRSIEHILEQVKGLVKEGEVKTIVLTGLETGMYGREIGANYSTLLKMIFEVEGDFEVAVAQFHPSGFDHYEAELIKMFSNPRVVDLQVPIQTTSSRLLNLMSRPPLPLALGKILGEISATNPGIVLRTDLMVGFPSETPDEFSSSVNFAAEYFDEISLYRFETRTGLAADKLGDKISKQETEKRREYAIKILSEKGKLFHCGSQDAVDLTALEQKRQEQRKSKKRDIWRGAS